MRHRIRVQAMKWRFTYLGLTLSATSRTFTRHIEERVVKTRIATATIKSPQCLSLHTAIQLFQIKLAPTASYGIPLIWHSLSLKDLLMLEKVEPAYLKLVLGVHRSTRNRLVYHLTGTRTFIEDLVDSLALVETEAYTSFIKEHEQKLKDVHPDFFDTPTRITDSWKVPNHKSRHTLTRFSAHGFHHKLCKRADFHEPDNGWMDGFISVLIDRYFSDD